MANYKRKKEGNLEKSSSTSNLGGNYVPKERWKSKLKRAMIHKHILEYEQEEKAEGKHHYKSPTNRGEFNNFVILQLTNSNLDYSPISGHTNEGKTLNTSLFLCGL